MKVWIFSYCRNEKDMMPWFLRHYAVFAEQIHIFDDHSDDGTREIVQAHPKAVLHDIPFTGLEEGKLMAFSYANIKEAIGFADYVMWPDADEFLYHPNMLECLSHFKDGGYNVVHTLGFNMMGKPLPVDDGKSQLTDIYRTGVRAPIYSKPIIVDPSANVKWSLGKHHLINPEELRPTPCYQHYAPEKWRVRLLHYRYLTPEYCRQRNARQYERSIHKGTAWSCAPTWTGEHSPEWVEVAIKKTHDVVHDDAHWFAPGETEV